MPRVDAITGCTVMTMGEFWQGEAAREGKGRAPADLMHEMYAEIDDSDAKEAARLRDPGTALALLREKIAEWNEVDPDFTPYPLPVKVESVESVIIGHRRGGDTLELVATYRAGNHTRFRVHLSEASYAGSFYEPPDYEINIVVGRVK